MSNLHAIAATEDALVALGERSIVFTSEMADLLTTIKFRLTSSDMAAEIEIDLKLAEINDPAAKALATKSLPDSTLFPSDSVVPTSKMVDFLLDLRTLLNG